MRIDKDKLDPVVVDLGLEGTTGRRHRRERSNIYVKNGWVLNKMSIPKLVKENEKILANLLDN
jgi:hypothetical protein